eukprot:gb/GEZN01002576.1/.p1 GENE.gb/GEZN01002576.1/~~gb/GEZN01002576.1/.p1  ORF type:complete len:505 (-),score=45.02 gb/GEZN01002576.1/:881-2395(-)
MGVDITIETLLDELEKLKLNNSEAFHGALNTLPQDKLEYQLETHSLEMDYCWVIITSVLVFWMQCGFAMLEAGSIRPKNVSNILFLTLIGPCVGALSFWLTGYGLAYGVGSSGPNPFIGTGNFALSQFTNSDPQYPFFFYELVFAATASTIVSGAIAERCDMYAYSIYAFIVSGFVYPVVAHWVWSHQGWLSASNPIWRYPCGYNVDACNGVIDFAGAGVVHLVGGTASAVAAFAIGPRAGRYEYTKQGKLVVIDMAGHSQVLVGLGTMILWMGWYGFNCGSTKAIANGGSFLAAKVCINTTMAAATAGTTVCFMTRQHSRWDVPQTCNGILAGLVSITAGCSTVEPWGAFSIGVFGGFIYMLAQYSIDYVLLVDDPLGAIPIHAMNGAWGVLAVGIFSSSESIEFAYGHKNDAFPTGVQFATQATAVLVIISWTASVCMCAWFFMTKILRMKIRVPLEAEKTGLDFNYMGKKTPSSLQTLPRKNWFDELSIIDDLPITDELDE